MNKDWKLKRYGRKDYSEVVDFPVEIVGRDGVVRRYSFEDSIRLYQRRITFAPIRYGDGEVVEAEVHHCQSRIDQLRRSYFHRFGWGTSEGEPSAETAFGDLAGELAAFVCRALHCDGRPEIRFDQLKEEESGASTWYLTPYGAGPSMILYAFRFSDSSDEARQRYFKQIQGLEAGGTRRGDGEQLLAFHHTNDCGFVLSGRAADFEGNRGPPGEDTAIDLTPAPWEEVLKLIRKGENARALLRCRAEVKAQPFHRNAYIAGAMLSAHAEDYTAVEEFADIGSRYFEDDAVLRYYLGIAKIHAGRDGGEDALREAIQRSPGLVAARMFLMLTLLRRGAYVDALALLQERSGAPPDDERTDHELDRLQRWLWWRRPGLALGACSIIGGILMMPWSALGVVPVIAGTVVVGGGWLALQRRIDRLTELQHGEVIRRGLQRLAYRPTHKQAN